MNNVKVTAKGTELPLMSLKGKPYLQVAHRLVWFREDHPNGRFVTSIVKSGDDFCVCRAEVFNGQGQLLSTAHKSETRQGFADFIEKSETGAIGRALAMAGYGTQFEPELDEGERLADSPIEPPKRPKTSTPVSAAVSGGPKAQAGASEKDLLMEAISTISLALVIAKKANASDLKAELKTRFGASRKEDLTEAQAKDFINYMKGLEG